VRKLTGILLIIVAQCTLVIGAVIALQSCSHSAESRHAAYVARWDSAGWQAQSDDTAFRTALDSRGQYTEVTCHRPHDGLYPLTKCVATADDGTHPSVPTSLLRR
jgi:hypothetical protein